MTDQDEDGGIHEVQTRNKAVKYQKDLVKSCHGACYQEGRIRDVTDLMIEIEAKRRAKVWRKCG